MIKDTSSMVTAALQVSGDKNIRCICNAEMLYKEESK